jgi:pimeloyl-ACP methyl ester carboxylesterase
MKTTMIRKSLATVIATALVATFSVATTQFAAAADAPTCNTVGTNQVCTGTDDLGAKYEIRMPNKFNGTLMLWSHGIRYAVSLPAITQLGLPAQPLNMAAEVAPSESVANALLAQGYALAGSGFNRQGWNAEDAVISNIQVINAAKDQFPKIKKVTAWGASMGGFITQSLQEQFPAMIDSAAPLCSATNTPIAEFKYAGDFLFGIKTFFDPTIMGSGYAAGQTGYMQMLGDIAKVLTVFNSISEAMTVDPLAPKWPATSTAPAALKAIPVRSALLLVGLMAGIPTQSNSFDASSGPAGPLETSFGLAISPALAVIENGVQGALLAIVGTYGEELKMGGRFYDNSKTNWATQISQDDLDAYNAGLSGTSLNSGRSTCDCRCISESTF